MLHLVKEAGLKRFFDIQSAGTAAYHVGKPADRRSAERAARRGIRLVGTARQFESADFDNFDYVLAMDADNHEHLKQLATNDEQDSQVALLRDFDPSAAAGSSVPDPYYGGEKGFDTVLDMCERACKALLAELVAKHQLSPK